MPQETILGNVILFFDKIGIYDVVLPFILVFAIVYAILEKSRILGMVKQGDKQYTNKNVNSLVAFVISFFVIASAQLVEIIAQVSSQVVILLLLSVFFLLLIGSFMATEKEVALEGPLQTFFIGLMLVGIFLIFLNAIKTKSGVSWLEFGYQYLRTNITSAEVASVIFIIFIIGYMAWLTMEDKPKKKE